MAKRSLPPPDPPPEPPPESPAKSPAELPAEKDLIRALRRQVARTSADSRRKRTSHLSPTLTLGIGDDCAILAPPAGHEILVTTDLSLETIHFRREWHTPESVGHRCLARGLSDLAAMGATPVAAFLSLALPSELVRSRTGHSSWRDRFLAGLLALAARCNVPLAGGDTSAAPVWPLLNGKSRAAQTSFAIADIVLVGSAPRGQSLRRSGAKPGDFLYVTGTLGGAAAELDAIAASPERFRAVRAEGPRDAHPHLFPEPKISAGLWLREHHCATAAIDVSDGLSTDLDHLCEESGCAATIEAAAIPIHPLAQRAGPERALQLALQGGEDYQLLFTSPAETRVRARIGGLPVTRIGRMRRARAGKPRILIAEDRNGKLIERPLKPAGWEHYRSDGRQERQPAT